MHTYVHPGALDFQRIIVNNNNMSTPGSQDQDRDLYLSRGGKEAYSKKKRVEIPQVNIAVVAGQYSALIDDFTTAVDQLKKDPKTKYSSGESHGYPGIQIYARGTTIVFVESTKDGVVKTTVIGGGNEIRYTKASDADDTLEITDNERSIRPLTYVHRAKSGTLNPPNIFVKFMALSGFPAVVIEDNNFEPNSDKKVSTFSFISTKGFTGSSLSVETPTSIVDPSWVKQQFISVGSRMGLNLNSSPTTKP